ncbi:MAG: hypothetical protein ACF8AM_21835, partial [Rhodopirellula sp. JB055]|uniref:hypothetical protein n=1 Tax=Rhodopirellula sp. JB055 TaxID=3342846 RepID=UPI00370A0F26
PEQSQCRMTPADLLRLRFQPLLLHPSVSFSRGSGRGGCSKVTTRRVSKAAHVIRLTAAG